ncbi:MAG: PKD domain-containing protein [Planctomycetota bacterium]|jgi:hypothetical protein
MRNAKMTIWMLAMVVSLAAPQVMALTQFNDGGTHDIDYEINDDVWVDYLAQSVQTTVNVLAGANIPNPYKLQTFEDSRTTISGGSVGTLNAFDSSRVTMSNGSVKDLRPRGNSQVTMSGGSVNSLLTIESSQTTVSGGLILALRARNNSQVTMSGGTISPYDIRLNDRTILTLEDSNFAVDGSLFGFGEITSILGGSTSYEPIRRLTGTLANGDKINNEFLIGNDAKIVLIPGPATPPLADADGPYSIYVGDTLTLDANGSTDANDDIVSYMWDLDDNNSFETDAGGQAIFDVNYTYLQSLGLIVDHTYDIHLKVTDSEGQSDVNGSTLTIVPKPAIEVAVDIKPGSCPNPVNVKSKGVLPVAILGSEDFDVNSIDVASIRLAGVAAIRSSYEDVATPVSDANECECSTEGPDGFLDLTLKFETQMIVEAIGEISNGDELTLELIGVLSDETSIEGSDCIIICGNHKPLNRADFNGDGIVDMADFAAFSENWLQSSIVEY